MFSFFDPSLTYVPFSLSCLTESKSLATYSNVCWIVPWTRIVTDHSKTKYACVWFSIKHTYYSAMKLIRTTDVSLQ